MEVWKDVKGFEALYQVSNLGNVRSVDKISANGKRIKGKILSQTTEAKGYKKVSLYKERKITTVRVHRLVATAFIPNPLNYQQVNHKDENKANNCTDNLEWCSTEYNCNHGGKGRRGYETLLRKGNCGLQPSRKLKDIPTEELIAELKKRNVL